MSQRQATSCKLPLLDGEDTNTAQLARVESEFQYVDKLQRAGKRDEASLSDKLCTAWGLLLRCYTGQDDISFHFRQNICDDLVSNSPVSRIYQSTFRVVFDEHENLLSCFAKAKDSHVDVGNQRGNLSLYPTASSSVSSSTADHQNTYVWVKSMNCKDAQDIAVEKVATTWSGCQIGTKV